MNAAATYPTPLADELQRVHDFLDTAIGPDAEPAPILEEIADPSNDAATHRQLLPRLLLTAVTSPSPALREMAIKHYLSLFQKTGARQSINDLLGFCMADYEDFDRVRVGLVSLLRGELRRNAGQWSVETVKFMLNIRRIFTISYSPQFAEGAVECLYQLFEESGQDSSTVLSRLVYRWMNQSLKKGNTPAATEKALKRRLARIRFFEVDPGFVESLYDRLMVEANPEKLIDTLNLLAHWYRDCDLDHPADVTVRGELYGYGRGYLDEASVLSRRCSRILEANGRILRRVLELMETWMDHPRLYRSAVDVLQRLPAARQQLRPGGLDGRPPFWDRFWKDRRREHVFQGALVFFETFVSGLTVNLDRRQEDEEGDQTEGDTYRQRLSKAYVWAKLESDIGIVDILCRVIGDTDETGNRRRAALVSLARINPADLTQRLLRFAREHVPEDTLVAAILSVMEKRADWEDWDICRHYFDLFDYKRRCPFLVALLKAAGTTGNAGMIDVLVPHALDYPDEKIRRLARRMLTQAGYDRFVDREEIQRQIRDLTPQQEKAFTDLTAVQDQTNERMSRRFELSKQMETTRHRIDSHCLALKTAVTRFGSFVTEKHIDLAVIDKRLEELTRKIRHLTKRKNELESQIDILLRQKEDLQNQERACQQDIHREAETIRRIQQRLSELRSERRRLESRRSQLTAAFDSAAAEARRIESEEQSRIYTLQQDYNRLEQREYSCLADIRSAESELNQLAYQESRLRNSKAAAQRQVNSYSRQYDAMGPDDDRSGVRSRLQSARNELQNVLSQISSLNNEIYSESSRRDRLQQEVNQIRRDGQNIQTDIRRSEERIQGAKHNVAARQYDLEACLREIVRNLNETEQQETALDISRQNQVRLESLLEDLRRTLMRLQEREAQLEAQLVPVIRDLKAAKREYQRINAQMEAEERAIAKGRAEADELRSNIEANLDNTRSNWDELDEQIRRLKTALGQLIKERNQCGQRFQRLSECIEDLKTQYRQLTERCQEMLLEKDRSAYSQGLLRRLQFNLAQLDRLDYCRLVSAAAKKFDGEKGP